MTDAALNLDVDDKKLKQTFADIQRAQKNIDFFNQKIAKNDPFSRKNLRESTESLTRWNRIEKEKNAQLRENVKNLELLARKEKDYQRILQMGNRVGAGYATMQNTLEDIKHKRAVLQGWQNNLTGNLRAGRVSADQLRKGLAGGVEGETSGIWGAVASKLGNLGLALAIAGAKQSVTGAFAVEKSMRDYSMIAPGELGGRRKEPVYHWGQGKTPGYWDWYYGDRSRFDQKADMEEQAREQKRLNFLGFMPTDTAEAAYRLRMTGGTQGGYGGWHREAARALTLSKLGMPLETSIGLKATAVAGGANVGKDYLADVFAKAVSVGLTGGRVGQFAESIDNLQKSAQLTADNTDPEKFKEVMYMFNRTGAPSLMAERGGRAAIGLQNALLNPGGGVAGQLISLKAAGFGKGNDYIGALETLSGGLTPEVLKNLLPMFRGAGRVGALGLSTYTKGALSLPQAKALLAGNKKGLVEAFGTERLPGETLEQYAARNIEASLVAAAGAGLDASWKDLVSKATLAINRLVAVLGHFHQQVVPP